MSGHICLQNPRIPKEILMERTPGRNQLCCQLNNSKHISRCAYESVQLLDTMLSTVHNSLELVLVDKGIAFL